MIDVAAQRTDAQIGANDREARGDLGHQTNRNSTRYRGGRPRSLRGARAASETADEYYGVIAQLNLDWRVVECRDRVQWILQRRGSPKRSRRDDWRGRSYCCTRDVLIRCTREYVGAIDPTVATILTALPEWIDRKHTISSMEDQDP